MENEIAEFTTPITTRAQLLRKFHRNIVETALSAGERACLQNVSAAISPTDDVEVLWSEEDLATFLYAAVPPHVQPLARQAVPVLFRLLVRFGQYPYHLRPSPHLTRLEVVSAVAQLTRRDDRLRQWGGEGTWKAHHQMLERRFRRVLFQCLVGASRVSEDNEIRGGSDDEDLEDALAILESPQTIRHPDHIGIAIAVRPPLPDPKDLPSSRSANLTGEVNVGEWRILLRLLQSMQTLDDSAGDLPVDQLDPVQGCEENAGLTWLEFERAATQVSSLLNSFEPLFGAFLKNRIDLTRLARTQRNH